MEAAQTEWSEILTIPGWKAVGVVPVCVPVHTRQVHVQSVWRPLPVTLHPETRSLTH